MPHANTPLFSRFSACLLALFIVLHGNLCSSADTPSAIVDNDSSCVACTEFDRLNTRVRDGLTGKAAAAAELQRLIPPIRDYYYAHGGKEYTPDDWVFPLAGYTPRALAGGKRHGYEPRGYDWFAGNRHTAHPSLDIFIHDRNQDEKDDRTGDYVPVLSMTGGIVVATSADWQTGSRLRGGKYLWIYDPSTDSLLYYAHNRQLAVTIGTIVKPGDVIATVGRSGYNAAKKRSPTHLHLTWLKYKNGSLLPVNPYPILVKSHKR